MPPLAPNTGKFAYQETGIEWLRGLAGCATDPGRGYLGDEPGLGKSRQLLKAAEGRTLVVAPAMVLDGGVWQDEHAKWRPDLDLTTVSYHGLYETFGNKNAKTGRYPCRPRERYADHWDTVIFDEAHHMKGRKTYWTVAAQKLETDQLFLASGTPIPNWAYELFTALQLIFPSEAKAGKRLGSYWRWADDWFRVGETEYAPMGILGVKDDSPEGWLRFYQENFKGRFLQRLRDDVLSDLPPMTRTQLLLPMSDAQRRVYKGLKKDYIAWTDSGEEVAVFSSGGLHTKLIKVATGLELVDDGAPVSPKFRALEERLRDQAHPSIVVGWFRQTAHLAAAAAVRAKKRPCVITGATTTAERSRIFRAFKNGEYDVLCSTFVIREGHTLVNADTVHMLERSYVPSFNKQIIQRVHRIGQVRPVTVLDYITKATVDTNALKLLQDKSDQQVKALRAEEFAKLL